MRLPILDKMVTAANNLNRKTKTSALFRMAVLRCLWFLSLLFLSVLAVPALADDCSDYPNGVLDGFAGTPAPSQLNIDRHCTIRNYTAANPFDTNISFFTSPGQNDERWVVIFDNVVHTGEMACNSVAGHKIWFTNGSSTSIQDGCQNYLIPVEKIDKQNPAGQTTASIGVPFTYTLTMPVLFDPGTGTVINTSGSVNTLHSIVLTDDLNATGADLTYLSHTAYLRGSGAAVSHSFSNVGGFLTFSNFFDSQSIIAAGDQVVIEVTVVLNDVPANTPGTQFVNVAKWDFGRLIDGDFFEPLPGEWGITEPLTIAAPELQVTKTGPLAINLGQSADFTIDVYNSGNTDAWNATIVDELPNTASGGTGGMCDTTPTILSARVFAADGVTTVPGKGPLLQGTDYALSYSGAPSCELTLTTLTSQAVIGPDQRLVIVYRTELDADTEDTVTLTNIAGAVEWSNDDDSNSDRQTYTRNLTNGTTSTLDHQDAHTLTVALSGYFFEKTVANLTSGQNPAITAAPGDILRYTLRLQTTDSAINGFAFYDDLGAMNGSAVFEPGSLSLIGATIPPGANTSNTNANGGTNNAGIVEVGNLSLGTNDSVSIQFDITLAAALIDGTLVTNQADLIDGVKIADSDDPNVNGQADPDVANDEDPTQLVIESEPPSGLTKANTQSTAAIGEQFNYRITLPATPHSAPLYDVRILDNLLASAADLAFVSVQKISASGSWTPINTGSATSLVIEDPVNGIDIPAGEQAVIEVTLVLRDVVDNVAGLTFSNTASFTYNQLDNNNASRLTGNAASSGTMTVIEPELTLEKSGPPLVRIGPPATFTLNIQNTGSATAYSLDIIDILPDSATGGMCDTAPTQISARVFQSDGVTPVSAPLNAGSDYATSFSGAPVCALTFTSSTLALNPGERLIISYDAYLDADTQRDEIVTNVAAVTQWQSDSPAAANAEARLYNRTLTNGTVGVLDHEDAHSAMEFSPLLSFEKTAINLSSGQSPATDAEPGDRLRYTLRLENIGAIDIDELSLVDELDRLNANPAFQPGTLSLVAVPPGSDTGNTSATGGAKGTGRLQIDNLSLAAGESLQVVFEVELAPVIANDSYVYNQSQMLIDGFVVASSDDPNINGAADPIVSGDEDPTRVQIESAPILTIEKISTDLTGDPNILLAGETLRYRISVQNSGDDNAYNTTLRDQIPANTNYVAGSTTLNGNVLADVSGTSPLVNGIALNSPRDGTAGFMPADASGAADTVATVEFDVLVSPSLLDGAIISNQGFVSVPAAAISDQPSDDPGTPIVDDPTRDVVGNVPLLFADKSVALQVDGGSPGIVDPGDTLRYTIRVFNTGNIPATEAELSDSLPANTQYLANSTRLNGIALPADGGTFPLELGVPISSSDLTPPLPGAGEGTLTAGEAATIQFDLVVAPGTATGTLISNQAQVATAELGTLLTDGDGDPATGPEPTVAVVGDVQQLAITKQVSVVGGGPAVAGATLEYLVQVTNIGAVPAQSVWVTDNLDELAAGQLTYVSGSASMNGDTAGLSISGNQLSADYSATYGPLPSGERISIRFQAQIDSQLAIGTTISNRAETTWNGTQTVEAIVSLDVGGTPGTGTLNGTAWHDANFNNQLDTGERLLEGWTVELYRNGQLAASTQTDADGAYLLSGLTPNTISGDSYRLVFVAPGAGPNTALLGEAWSADFTNGLQEISDILVSSGSNLVNLDQPIDPSGVVYDAVARTPVAGAALTLLNAASGSALPSRCFDDPQQQGQVTSLDGYYKFDLNFSAPGCPSGAAVLIDIIAPGSGYIAGYSQIIPPISNQSSPFNVPACPGSTDDVIPATTAFCEIQPSELAPGTGVAARSQGTNYHVYLVLNNSNVPGSSQVFNNHIPLDPVLDGALSISKTTPMVNVNRGQLVPYNITVRNSYGLELQNINLVDRFPPGFHYIEGSARLDGVAQNPVTLGRELVWNDLTLAADGEHSIQLLLGVGSGVSEGEFVNRAQAMNSLTGGAMSGEASATVRLVPDPTFDCTDVMGKVFDDDNRNGLQDNDEPGIANVRVVSVRGLAATTDAEGRFHFTCAAIPREGRGSNLVLKLDDRTLPSGYRASTDLLQVKRATRGKALHFNFGASIHRVVGLDLADAVFEPGTTEIRPQWLPRFDLLLEELQKGPAILRLSYLADLEDPNLVDRRLQLVKQRIASEWEVLDCCYKLVIEPEVFWRLGGPADEVIKEKAKQKGGYR